MPHVYINLGRIIPEGFADKKLEKILVDEDIKKFNEKHPIIGYIFNGLITSYFTSKGHEKYKPAQVTPCE